MKYINLLLKELIYSGHIVGASAAIYVLPFILINSVNVEILAHFIVYLSFIPFYLYDRFKDLDVDMDENKDRSEYLKMYARNYKHVILTYLFILFGLISWYGSLELLVFISVTISFGFSYNRLRRLTNTIPLFKNIYFGLYFFSVVCYFLFIQYNLPLNLESGIYAFSVFIISLFQQFFLDYKDLKGDSGIGLKTLPLLVNKSQYFLISEILLLCLYACTGLLIILNSSYLPLLGQLVFLPFAVYILYGVYRKPKSKYFIIAMFSYIIFIGPSLIILIIQ